MSKRSGEGLNATFKSYVELYANDLRVMFNDSTIVVNIKNTTIGDGVILDHLQAIKLRNDISTWANAKRFRERRNGVKEQGLS